MKDEVEIAWDYYKVHVKHRKSMLNFLLVATAFFAAAFATLIKSTNHSHVAVPLALSAALTSFLLFYLDSATLLKIQRSKVTLSVLLERKVDSQLCRLLVGREDQSFARDYIGTGLIEIVIGAMWLVLSLYPAEMRWGHNLFNVQAAPCIFIIIVGCGLVYLRKTNKSSQKILDGMFKGCGPA